MRGFLTFLAVFMLTGGAVPPAAAQEFALDAPASVTMRDTFGVGWTAPQAKGGLIEIRPTGPKARRVAYAYTLKNPQPVEAPETRGESYRGPVLVGA